MRRFLDGRVPAGELEVRTFADLAGLSDEAQRLLACAVRRFDALPRMSRDGLFGEAFAEPDDEPLGRARLVELGADPGETVPRQAIGVTF